MKINIFLILGLLLTVILSSGCILPTQSKPQSPIKDTKPDKYWVGMHVSEIIEGLGWVSRSRLTQVESGVEIARWNWIGLEYETTEEVEVCEYKDDDDSGEEPEEECWTELVTFTVYEYCNLRVKVDITGHLLSVSESYDTSNCIDDLDKIERVKRWKDKNTNLPNGKKL